MALNIEKITDGVDGLFVKNSRFNTTLISFNYFLPLNKEEISANALLPFILTSCSAEYDDFTKLNRAFNMLYGADLSLSVAKNSDNQHIKITLTVINDSFALNGESIVLKAVDLILSMIFRPRLMDGSFCTEDVEREKRKMVENILGEINEKRIYAKNRTISEMYSDTPYGLNKYGTLEKTKELTNDDIYKAWHRLIYNSYIRVQVIGAQMPDGLFKKIADNFKDIERNITTEFSANLLASNNTVNYVTDNMNITQGKLVLGFSSETNGNDCYNLKVMTDIFGGGPYSALFENVREKMSLCYYCSASSAMQKGHLLVESGVEFENMDKAEKEILAQLKSIQDGNFTDETFESSIKSICGALGSYNDSLGALDSWYSSRVFFENNTLEPSQAADMFRSVTRQQVVDAARGIKLHTVYRLMGNGEAQCNE